MSPLKLTPRRSAQLDAIWRILCRIVFLSGVAAFASLWGIFPSWLMATLLAPGLLVMLVTVVAWFADFTGSSTSPVASTES